MAPRGGFRYGMGGNVPLPPSSSVIQAEQTPQRPQVSGYGPVGLGGGVTASPRTPSEPLTVDQVRQMDEEEARSEPRDTSGMSAIQLYAENARAGGDGGGFVSEAELRDEAAEEDDGGIWGAVSGGLGTVLKGGLNAIDVGHRTALATADQVRDAAAYALPGDQPDWVGDDAGADAGQWWDEVRGQAPLDRGRERIPDTGVGWLDAGLGFAADVATDPLTYVTAGVGSGVRTAGAGGRAAQAAKAAQQGLGNDVVETIGRKGISYVDDATRESLGLGRHGLRFGRSRIPGTGAVTQRGGQAISGARRGLGRLPGADAVRDFRTPQSLGGQATRRLATGQGDLDAGQASAILSAAARGKGAAGRARSGDLHQMDRLLKEIPRSERQTSIYALEESTEPWAQQIRGLMGDAKDRAVQAGIDVGDRGTNYAPHMWTDKGRQFLGWADEDEIPGTVSSLGERKILPGNTLRVKGQEIPIEQGTAREVNSKLKEAFPEFGDDFIQTDASKVLPKYFQNMAESTGRGVEVGEMAQRGAAYVPEQGSVTQPSDVLAGGDEFAQTARDDVAALSRLDDGSPEMATTRALLGDYLRTAEREGMDKLTSGEVASITARRGGDDETAQRLMEEGWEYLDGAYSATGGMVPPEVGRLMRNAQEGLEQPGRFKKLWKENMDFFRTYATLSPGFHVRNAYSATFMNLADGVDAATQGRALKRFGTWMRHGDDWLDRIPAGERELADQTLDVVYASGAGGRFEAAETGMDRGSGLWSRLKNNRATRGSVRAGEYVEGSVRYAAAYDALAKGNTFDEAVNRVRSLHFDYGELSNADRAAKNVVPFWTFMSRNLPLQMQMMVTKPGRYRAWEHFKDNMGDDEALMPSYWEEAGAFTLPAEIGGDQMVIDPQFPHLSAMEDIRKAGDDPYRFAANLSPALTLPIEHWGDKQLFSDIPFDNQGEFAKYALGSAIPTVGKFQRSVDTPLSPDYQTGKRIGDARARELGLPVRRLTEERQETEKERREREAAQRVIADRARAQEG